MKTSVEGSFRSAEAWSRGLGEAETIKMDPVVHSQPLELDMYEVY